MGDPADFATEPAYIHKFKVSKAKEIIAAVLKSRLAGCAYHADNTSTWAREIADAIKSKLKEENWERYKYVVQVFIGEQRGEGVRMASRCLWDEKTDNYASDIFMNESIFCVATAFGVYHY